MSSIPPLEAFSLGADAAYLLRRPLSAAPDGHDESNRLGTSPIDCTDRLLLTIISVTNYKAQRHRETSWCGAFLDAALHPNAVNDRNGIVMDVTALLSHLPPSSAVAKTWRIQQSRCCMTLLPIHFPPAVSLGPVHAFRQADGRGNSMQNLDVRRAAIPYARSVQGTIPTTALPDPGLIFDILMRARDRRNHPGGNSSFTFAFATLVAHSLFRTDPSDWNIKATSSYLDLSPLYGINQATQDLVRSKAEGRGLMYPDTFSEERLTFLPPATSALLVIFNRNHTYIADMLLKINERGRWSDPPPLDSKLRVHQDEELFQTAKLINCGHFINLIIGDYAAGFLGLLEGIVSPLFNNAFRSIKKRDGRTVERGEGNQCSVEFNVLYRWHPTLSERDQRWTEETFKKVFGEKPLDELRLKNFGPAFGRILAAVDPDPRKRTFGGFIRGTNGKFSDDDIATILLDATESRCLPCLRDTWRIVPDALDLSGPLMMPPNTIQTAHGYSGSCLKDQGTLVEIRRRYQQLYDIVKNVINATSVLWAADNLTPIQNQGQSERPVYRTGGIQHVYKLGDPRTLDLEKVVYDYLFLSL
ncbi:heme peroxidase [Mycena epipterygia]|nr:heme peroxidase [Mycena epipterygia]